MIVCLLSFVLLAARIPALREFAKSVTPDIMARLGEGGPFAVVVKVSLAVVLAPLSEDCSSAVGSGKHWADAATPLPRSPV